MRNNSKDRKRMATFTPTMENRLKLLTLLENGAIRYLTSCSILFTP